METKEIFNLQECSKYLSINVHFIRKLVEAKEIPCVRFGRRYVFPKNAIDNWLLENANNNEYLGGVN
jgi:excisionase family DNA binding protein